LAEDERLICPSAALAAAGDGVRFTLTMAAQSFPVFVIRFEGAVRAYLNRCAHMPMELDWKRGRFFDGEGRLLLCSTHGAAYDPMNGACRGGPCDGGGLYRLPVIERDGSVYLQLAGASQASIELDFVPDQSAG
jgi:nitrite reductase/ring-hydroxylating ferredoxin subunit